MTMKAFVLLAATALIGSPALAQEAADCELHVWAGGFPNAPVVKSNAFIKVTKPRCDATDPLCPSYFYDPVKRIHALDEGELRALFPSNAKVSIVYHDDLVDLAKTKLTKNGGRLSTSTNACYADLMLSNIYGIFPRKRWDDSIVRTLVFGDDRLVVEFQLRSELPEQKKPLLFVPRNDAPVSNAQSEPQVYAASVAKATNEVLRQFVLTARPYLKLEKPSS